MNDREFIILKNEHDSTASHSYSITYPDSIAVPKLASALENSTESLLEWFLSNVPKDTTAAYFRPWELLITIDKVFESNRFIAYLGKSYTYTGGAHGMPGRANFVFDKQKDRLIDLRDLFKDSSALQPISRYAIGRLASKVYDKASIEKVDERSRQWLKEGAAPMLKNYSIFYPGRVEDNKASGIEFVFTAYQVAPYVAGMPHVFVPDSIFYKYLTDEYRSAFTEPDPF